MTKKILKIVLYFALILAGYVLHKTGIINDLYVRYNQSKKSATVLEHEELAKGANPNSFELVLSEENLNKLYEQRRLAIEVGQYYKDDPRFTGYLKGKLVHGSDTLKIKLRQKGLFIDHFEDSLKSSYKIKLKGGNTFMGMDRFAIQHPKTRGYLNEWYLHELLDYCGLISIRYDFINVTINGRNSGIYAIEENIHKNLIENNQLKEGPIFRFEVEGEGPIFYHEIKPYNSKRLKKDSGLLLQYQYAEQLLVEFRNETKKTSDIFDIERMAKFYALIDLTGHHHASHVFNLKFYFNPVTGLIEPIGYDNSSFISLDAEGLLGTLKNVGGNIKNRGEIPWKNDPFAERLFNDELFFKAYVKYLQEYSNPDWLSNFFNSREESALEKLKIIWNSYPEYSFEGKDVLVNNQLWIKNYLNELKLPVIKGGVIENDNGISTLKVKNQNELPILITSVKINNEQIPIKKVLLQPHFENEYPAYESIVFNSNIIDSVSVDLNYKYLGTDNEQTSTYNCQVVDLVTSQSGIKNIPILHRYSDLINNKNLNISGDTIKFQKGEITIQEDLIIRSGYKVIIEPGTKINLMAGSKIISHSPFYAVGTKMDSIVFNSSDKLGQGLFVLNTSDTSKFEYCQFKNMSNLWDARWKLSGAVNFYHADVHLDNCEFKGNLKGDDIVNVMNSHFEVNNCYFHDILSDALDGDFAIGEINDCLFEEIGNDALDFSGSDIKINDCKISNVHDKALSAGENSLVEVKNLEIDQCEIALTSKDKSEIKGENIGISNSIIGICAFKKKSQFGPGRLELDNSRITDPEIKFLIEIGSQLIIDGETIEGDQTQVEDVLYGNVYGKRTVK